jgi:O-antigen ligase
MDFLLFLLVTGILMIRPAEIVPGLLGLPLYEVSILACLAVAWPRVIHQLTGRSLAARPATLCVLGLLLAVVLSQAAQLSAWGVRNSGVNFAKVVLYYLLLVGVLNTPRRLRVFSVWLAGCILVLTVLAVLQFHGTIDVPALAAMEDRDVDDETGEPTFIPRLRSTGIYHDPNDLGLIIVVGTLIALYWLGNAGNWALRAAWLVPLGVFGYALLLTQSRGGFLALVAGLLVLACARYGWRKTLALAGVGLPVLLLLFGGRQTSLSTGEGTSQERIRLWSEGLTLFAQSPVFGIGQGEFADQVGLVAHNSFLHCYVELGFAGGALFLGGFLWSLAALARTRTPEGRKAARVVLGLRPYLLAIVAAYAVGLLSLSRAYVEPTYLVLGLGTVYAGFLAPVRQACRAFRPAAFVRRLGIASVVFLVVIAVFVRTFAHWG